MKNNNRARSRSKQKRLGIDLLRQQLDLDSMQYYIER